MVDVFSDVERDTAHDRQPGRLRGHRARRRGRADRHAGRGHVQHGRRVHRESSPSGTSSCGIAETNSVSVAAGLASLRVCAVHLLDVAVRHAEDRPSSGAPTWTTTTCRSASSGGCPASRWATSAPSHYAVEDIAIARTMNNTTVLSPADPRPARLMRSTATVRGPVYIRIAEAVDTVYDEAPDYAFGKWPRLRAGGDLTLDRARHGRRPGAARPRRSWRPSTTASRPTSSTPPTCGRTTRPRCVDERRQDRARCSPIEEHSVVGGLGAIVAETVARAQADRRGPRPVRAAGRGPRGRRARRAVRVLRADRGQRGRQGPGTREGIRR